MSKHLTDSFGKGFSVANIKNIRQFYQTFPILDELATQRVANLSWSHLRLIMRLESKQERSYYLQETDQQNWSVRLLERNIKSGYYKRLLSSKSGVALQEKSTPHPSEFIKDPYVLEFLNVPEDLRGQESLLESNIIEHLQKFLLELGKGFSFVARQMRVSTETSHFYVDLVFYNYLLKCFVVIDLKTEKLTHQDIGQMDFYVRYFENEVKQNDDNPTIGIILCSEKNETIVKYSMLNDGKSVFASKYKLYLPKKEELIAELKKGKFLLEQEKNK